MTRETCSSDYSLLYSSRSKAKCRIYAKPDRRCLCDLSFSRIELHISLHLSTNDSGKPLFSRDGSYGTRLLVSIMSPNITSLPVEIITLITENLATDAQLKLKLTCVTLASATPRISCKVASEFGRFISAHLCLEAEAARRGKLKHVICTVCGKVKQMNSATGFSDAQSVVGVLHRHCITCCSGSCFVADMEVGRNERKSVFSPEA